MCFELNIYQNKLKDSVYGQVCFYCLMLPGWSYPLDTFWAQSHLQKLQQIGPGEITF